MQETYLSNPKTRPALRQNGKDYSMTPKGLLVHWSGNIMRGAGDESHFNFLNNEADPNTNSAHVFGDSDSTRKMIPFDEIAHHCNDPVKRKNLPARQKLFGRVSDLDNPNRVLIGYELCVDSGVTEKETLEKWVLTYRKGVKDCAEILLQFGWTVDDMYRHFDITGKDCPRMFMPTVIKVKRKKIEIDFVWSVFKDDVKREMENIQNPPTIEKEVITEVQTIVKPLSDYPRNELFRAWWKSLF